jgi:hypothetical protein
MRRVTDDGPLSSQERWSEDLFWQAARGVELGRKFCSCAGRYHTLWGALRASGFLGSLHTEEATLASTIAPLIDDKARLLIAGSADPATLCAIGRISKSEKLNATVVDQCLAPLKLIQEFAMKRDVSCQTIQADLVEFDSIKKWDVVFLNYTLSFIEASLRRKFFGRLANCLEVGGTLVCLAKTGVPAESHERRDLESAWFENARKALQESKLDVGWDRAELDEAIRHYAASRTARRFNIISASEIVDALEEVGLTSCVVKTTARKWVLDGVAEGKADAESSVIVTAVRDR